MDYLKAFIVGGLICAVGQILIDKTKLTPARILVTFVVVGVDVYKRQMLNGKDMFEPDSKTCIGALPLYISNSANTKFQPMNANFGIIDGLNERIRNKAERYNKIANRALDIMKDKLKGENDDE